MIDYDLSHVPTEWLTLNLTPGTPQPLSLYRPVLALTITRDDQVLVCVRDPKTNPVHPNVLSAPTIRTHGISTTSIVNGAEELLYWKLGLTEDQAWSLLPDPRWMTWQGHSLIGTLNNQPVTYPLTMVNAHIETTLDFPESTDAYSWIGWVRREAFIKAVESRDITAMGVDFGTDPVLYGLCTHSTSAMLKSLEGK